MARWEGRFGGSNNRNIYLVVNVDLLSQDIASNSSRIRYNAWIEQRSGAASTSPYNGYRTAGHTNINGYNPERALGSYNFRATNRYDLAVNEDYTIGHDGNGNANPYFGADYNLDNSPYVTSAGAGGNMGLPQINRYLNIDSWNIINVTEKSANISVSVSNGTADAVDYQLNGGDWINGYSGQFQSVTFPVNGLIQNTTYSVVIRVHNAAGGLFTGSGVRSITTDAAIITAYTLTPVTDSSLQIALSTNFVSDDLEYQINNSGTWITVNTGDYTSTQQTINGFSANNTYAITVRAKHKDSQTYTATLVKNATTAYPTPLQSTNLVPSSGSAVSTLTPTLTWKYAATSPDTQGYFEVIIYSRTSGLVLWDSGKITSGNNYVTVPNDILAYNINYQWKVKTWSKVNIEGSYTSLALFKTSQPPTTFILSPQNLVDLPSDTPVFTWAYADPEGTTQAGFGIKVLQISSTGNTTGTIVYTNTSNTYTDNSFSMPPGILQSGNRYLALIYTVDGDGIASDNASVEFTITYIGPPKPNVFVDLAEDELFNRISVTTNKPDNDSYETDSINIFKRVQGTTDWTKIGTVNSTAKYVEDFESTNSWMVSPLSASLSVNSNSKHGPNSLSFNNSTFGVATYTHTTSLGSATGYDKARVWIRTTDVAIIGTIEFRFGADASNYYSFTISQEDLDNDVWNSIEIDFNDLNIIGSPSLSNINWDAVVVGSHTPSLPGGKYGDKYNNARYANADGTAVPDADDTATSVADGVLLIDGLRLISSKDQAFIYDYNLANYTTYEYSASSFSSQENLSSAKQISNDVISILYTTYKNTYLIPVGNENNSVIGFMSGDSTPAWTRQTDTQYYNPIGSRTPVTYILDTQDYVTGSIDLTFLDGKLNCKPVEAIHKLEAIRNYKPILLRTWWGDNYYISIDGKVSPSRKNSISWVASFNFTEIGNGS